MQVIRLETEIAAPVERCFLLSLSIDLQMKSTAQSQERAIAGRVHGVIGPGETVTWEGRHFGLRMRHQSVISEYDRPWHFQDRMVRGRFRSFVHDHFFEALDDGRTRMRDELRFAAPYGVIGRVVEAAVLRSHLRELLERRNAVIRQTAEADDAVWRKFLEV